MRTIFHVSDLHFGREDPPVVEALLRELQASPRALLVVSGDLTQRARRSEFQSARAFLDATGLSWLAVPGNHDIPLFDLLRRFVSPLGRFHRYVSPEENPFVEDEELAVLGLNTARSNTWKNGRLSADQIAMIRQRLDPLPGRVFKVVVTHHPFVPPPRDPAPPLVGRGPQALGVAEACGVELLLAGHLHQGFVADVRRHHLAIRRSILVAQAGTAVSHRRRHEPNSINVVIVDLPRLVLEVRSYRGTRFETVRRIVYRRRGEDWQPEA
jgi:3',5'-cyclic AMP phosphodiesterase CpdA